MTQINQTTPIIQRVALAKFVYVFAFIISEDFM